VTGEPEVTLTFPGTGQDMGDIIAHGERGGPRHVGTYSRNSRRPGWTAHLASTALTRKAPERIERQTMPELEDAVRDRLAGVGRWWM
jgi:hypothetical protein